MSDVESPGAFPPPIEAAAALDTPPGPSGTGPEGPAGARVPRVGELTPAWRMTLILTWVGAFLAYLAVWKASGEIGIATWWLGPRSHPQPLSIRLFPFAMIAVFGILAGYNLRRLPWISLAGSVLLALIAIPDLTRSGGLAAVELAIAGAVALVSLGSFTGMYRAAASDTDR